MSSISNDGERRRPLPVLYEKTYWRLRLLHHLVSSGDVQSRLQELKTVREGHDPFITNRSRAERDADDGGDIDDEIAGGLFASFLEGRHLRVEDFYVEGTAGPIPLMDTSFPEAMFAFLRKFGLTRNGLPAAWAIRPFYNMLIGRPDLSEVQMFNMNFYFERWMYIHVAPHGASVEIQRDGSKVAGRPEWSTRVGGRERYRFDEWDELTRVAQEAAAQAVEQLRREYHEKYPPRINPSTWEKRELHAQNLAYQLTRRAAAIHRNDRRKFCVLIGLDNPGAPKLPRK